MENLNALTTGVCVVTFTKKNGEERVMRCTQNMDTIPSEKHPIGTGVTYTDNQVRVFDLDKSEWRSFRKDSIISVVVE
jgi:hypothetical protein